jgi:hypothetical protein
VELSIVKIVRGANTAVAVVSAPAGTQLLTAATTAATVDQHLDKFTLTTPAYIDNDEYYFLKAVAVAAATTQIDLLAAVANYTPAAVGERASCEHRCIPAPRRSRKERSPA